MQDLAIKFQGFHASKFTEKYLNQKLGVLIDEAPYGANITAHFSRNTNEFKGNIIINSAAGRFFAVAKGKKLKEVTHKLMTQIHKQLQKWKSKRFQKFQLNHLHFIESNETLKNEYEVEDEGLVYS